MDFDKAFDSIDRTVLWKLLRHYGLPAKFVTLIKYMYEGFTGHVIFIGQVSEGFQIGAGVQLVFLIAIDWTIKRFTENHRTVIQWNLFSQLEDLDFADDQKPITTCNKKKRKASRKTSQLVLKINVGQTKVMKISTRSSEPISLESGTVEEVLDFIYLGCVISINGEARHAFRTLRPVWLSYQVSINTKIRIFNTNVKPVLLYGCENYSVSQQQTPSLYHQQSPPIHP